MICASALIKDGVIYVGKRHGDIYKLMPKGFLYCAESGFVTDEGKFVGRKEALRIAIDCGQIIKKTGGMNSDELFSEDIFE